MKKLFLLILILGFTANTLSVKAQNKFAENSKKVETSEITPTPDEVASVIAIKSFGQKPTTLSQTDFFQLLILGGAGNASTTEDRPGQNPAAVTGFVNVMETVYEQMLEMMATGATQDEILELIQYINHQYLVEEVLNHFEAGDVRGQDGWYYYLALQVNGRFKIIEIYRGMFPNDSPAPTVVSLAREILVKNNIPFGDVITITQANRKIRISTSDSEMQMLNFQIFDLAGKIVQSGQTAQNQEVDISNIQTGVYLVSATSGNKIYRSEKIWVE